MHGVCDYVCVTAARLPLCRNKNNGGCCCVRRSQHCPNRWPFVRKGAATPATGELRLPGRVGDARDQASARCTALPLPVGGAKECGRHERDRQNLLSRYPRHQRAGTCRNRQKRRRRPRVALPAEQGGLGLPGHPPSCHQSWWCATREHLLERCPPKTKPGVLAKVCGRQHALGWVEELLDNGVAALVGGLLGRHPDHAAVLPRSERRANRVGCDRLRAFQAALAASSDTQLHSYAHA